MLWGLDQSILANVQQIEVGKNTFCVTDDFLEEFPDFNRRQLQMDALRIIDWFSKAPGFKESIGQLGRRTGLKGIAVLRASGGTDEDGLWHFQDRKNTTLVQNWINMFDGKCLALIICACNPDGLSVFTTESLLVYPKYEISIFKVFQNPNVLRVSKPLVRML